MSANDYQHGGSHYKDMPVQPWEVMEAVLTYEEWVGYLRGCIIKYSMRAGRKIGASVEEDKAKMQHYMDKLDEVLHGE